MSAPVHAAPGGWRDAALRVAGGLFEIGRSRLALASAELAEERLRLASLMTAAILTLFLLFVGLVLGVTALVLWCEPANRLSALAGLSGLFALGAAVGAWRWCALVCDARPLLQDTLAELAQDQRTLASFRSLP